MEIPEVKDFLISLGLKPRIDFRVNESIDNVEFNINAEYFCSVGKWTDDPRTWEVFENAHGVEWDDNGNALTDGEIWQFKVYCSLRRALLEAVRYKKAGKLPEVPLRRW